MHHREEKIRAFLAIDPPEGIRETLVSVQNTLKKELPGVRWVSPEGIHLTLKFFGQIGKRELASITALVPQELMDASPLKLSIESIGVFPHLRRPRVLWLGTGGEVEKLVNLTNHLECSLEKAGFPREERPFTPHWTLARFNDFRELNLLSRIVEENREKQWGVFEAEALILFRSELTPQGAIYTPLEIFKLRKTGLKPE